VRALHKKHKVSAATLSPHLKEPSRFSGSRPLGLMPHARSSRSSRIGFLGLAPAAAWSAPVEALRARLRDLGYVEGKNIVIEWRWAEKSTSYPNLQPLLR
jgi:hypothetical protein